MSNPICWGETKEKIPQSSNISIIVNVETWGIGGILDIFLNGSRFQGNNIVRDNGHKSEFHCKNKPNIIALWLMHTAQDREQGRGKGNKGFPCHIIYCTLFTGTGHGQGPLFSIVSVPVTVSVTVPVPVPSTGPYPGSAPLNCVWAISRGYWTEADPRGHGGQRPLLLILKIPLVFKKI